MDENQNTFAGMAAAISNNSRNNIQNGKRHKEIGLEEYLSLTINYSPLST